MWIFPWEGVGPTHFHKPTIWVWGGGDHNSCGCVPHLPSRLEKHGKSTLGLVGKRALTGDPGYILMFLCSYSTHFALHPTPPTPVTYEGDQRPFRHGKYGARIC